MTTYTFPSITPNNMGIIFDPNAKIFRSPFTGSVRAIGRGGELLALRLSFRNLRNDNRGELMGFLAKMNGPEHRMTLQNHAEYQRGIFGGSPLVAGAGQAGRTLNIDNCSNSITDWIKRGDWFGAGGELKIATDAANTNGSGQATLAFWPALRNSPDDDSAVIVSAATGIFMLAEDSIDSSHEPGKDSPLTDISFVIVEDITI